MPRSSSSEPKSEDNVQQLYQQVLDSENSLLAIQAVYELGKIGSPEALTALLDGFQVPDAEVKLAILDMLSQAQYFDEKIVQPVSQLLTDDDPEVRSQAIELLGSTKNKNAVPALIGILSDTNKDIRLSAIDALGAIGDNQAVPVLIELLQSKTWEDRFHTVDALGMIGDPLSIDALADELKDKNPKVRENAALSVTLFNHPKIIQALLELLKDSKPEVVAAAAYTLGEMKETSAVPSLLELLESDIIDMIVVGCEALAKVRDVSAIPALIELLNFPAEEVRSAAQNALDFFGPLEIVGPALKSMLEDAKLRYFYYRLMQRDPETVKSLNLPDYVLDFLKDIRNKENEE